MTTPPPHESETPLDVISLKFRSGNGVAVESVRITAEEWVNVQHEFIVSRAKLLEQLSAANAQISALHERLEDNRVYDANGNRVEVEPGSIPDGIDCRDETIKMLEEQIAELKKQLGEARDLARFMAATWCATDNFVRTECKGDALIRYPVIQGTRNQLDLMEIAKQQFGPENVRKAIRALKAKQP